jgi:hypothetical protein
LKEGESFELILASRVELARGEPVEPACHEHGRMACHEQWIGHRSTELAAGGLKLEK